MVTKMLHYDQDERQTDGSRHWDTIRPVLLKAFAQERARDFDEGCWLHLIHEGSNKKRLEYCNDNNGSLCYLRAVQGHSGGSPISPELMNYKFIPYKWKVYIFHRGISWFFSVYSGEWNNSWRKRGGQGSPSSLSNTTESFQKKTPEEEKPHFDYTVPQKKIMKLVRNATKMLFLGTIEESARSRIATLANKIIGNQYHRHSARRQQ